MRQVCLESKEICNKFILNIQGKHLKLPNKSDLSSQSTGKYIKKSSVILEKEQTFHQQNERIDFSLTNSRALTS